MILDFFRWLGWLPARQTKIPASDIPKITDPFEVIPVRPEKVETRYDSIGNIHLRLNAEPDGSVGSFARKLGYDYSRKLELDKYGTEYYNCVDGETTLGTIVAKMAKKFNKDRKEMESSVILFTRKLMQMNFIVLKIPRDDKVNPE